MENKRTIIDWFLDPFVKDIVIESQETISENISKVEFSKEKTINIFRPKTFDEYIGQEKNKKILKAYLSAIKERGTIFPHTLIYGQAGSGKTTLARLIAKELGLKFKETISSEILNSFMLKFKIAEVDGGILFLDEIHGMSRELVENIYTIMEDFTHEGESIKPFTLIGATTELGEILQNKRPFYDRFKLLLEIADYTEEDISIITSQYRLNVFACDDVDKQIYAIIASNSRLNPRHAIRLLEAVIYLKDIKTVLDNFNIIKEGFTVKDIKILEYLIKNEKGVGLQAISSYMGIAQQTYLYDIEPYLMKKGLIIRSPRGRKISDDGKEFIKQIKELK